MVIFSFMFFSFMFFSLVFNRIPDFCQTIIWKVPLLSFNSTFKNALENKGEFI